VLQLLYILIRLIQPVLVPVCFFFAWGLTFMFAWSLWTAIRDSAAITKRMHQIPCPNCQFFTGDYRLKCTVQPSIANSEEAINCNDYQPKTNSLLY